MWENEKDLEKSESEDKNDMVGYEEEDIVDVWSPIDILLKYNVLKNFKNLK